MRRHRRNGPSACKNTKCSALRRGSECDVIAQTKPQRAKPPRFWGGQRVSARDVIEERGSQGPKRRTFCLSGGVKCAALSRNGAPRVRKLGSFCPPAGSSARRCRRSGLPGSENTNVYALRRGQACDVVGDWGSQGSETRTFLPSGGVLRATLT